MIATVEIADLGARRTLSTVRHRPAPNQVPGLRWLDMAIAAPLASKRPPQFGRPVMIGFWDSADAANAFRDSHPIAAPFRDGMHATLRPLRAFGSWPGLDDDIPRSRVTPHEGPVMVLTLAYLRLNQAGRFLRASRPAERAARDADGAIWATASARPARRPFMATVSLWDSAEAAAAYAYNPPGGHPDAITRQRKKDFHHESAFVRFEPLEITGTVGGTNPFDAQRVSLR